MLNPAFTSGKRLSLSCGSGTRSALAGKTFLDMGLGNLASLAGGIQGGIQGGRQAGGELERGGGVLSVLRHALSPEFRFRPPALVTGAVAKTGDLLAGTGSMVGSPNLTAIGALSI